MNSIYAHMCERICGVEIVVSTSSRRCRRLATVHVTKDGEHAIMCAEHADRAITLFGAEPEGA